MTVLIRANLRQVNPPDVGRNSAWLAVYWFLEWHKAMSGGRPYEFRSQRDLAAAVGVAPSVITRLRRAHERGEAPWLVMVGKTANTIDIEPE